MRTKESVISQAREYGSTAATFRGALRAIYRDGRSVKQQLARGADTPVRNARALAAYRREVRDARATRITAGLDLWTREDAEASEALRGRLAASWPYRRSESGWAGGNHAVSVALGDSPEAAGGSTRAWSNNGKWSGTDSHASLTITRRAVRILGTALIVDGRILVDAAPETEPGVYAVAWIEQARGFGLKVVRGYCIHGHLRQAASLLAAKRSVSRAVARRMGVAA